MISMSAGDARDHFSDVLNRAAFGKERIVLTRHGRDLAAVVPLEDLELLSAIENRMDLAEAKEALAEVEHEGTISSSDLKREFGL